MPHPLSPARCKAAAAANPAPPSPSRALADLCINTLGSPSSPPKGSPSRRGAAPYNASHSPKKHDSRAARAAFPLPHGLANQDPFARSKVAAPRPKAPQLVRRKSISTLQVQKDTAQPVANTFVRDRDLDRKARQRCRMMLAQGPQGAFQPPEEVVEAKMWALALKRDETLLAQYEGVATPGALPLVHREEAEHMAQHGLSDSVRQRARALAQKHNPFLRSLWRTVDNPAVTGPLRRLLQETQAPQHVHLPHLPTHTAHATLLHEGYPPPLLDDEEPAAPAVAKLVSDSGKSYWVSSPLSRGGFKRFSVGLTEADEAVGVLMMRGENSCDVFGDDGPEHSASVINTEIQNLSAFSDDFEIFDSFHTDGIYYVVVPLYDANSLQSAFQRLPEELRYPYGLQLLPDLLEAIIKFQQVHDAAHGDIKPPNFLCTSSGRVVLSDFGLTEKFDITGAINRKDSGTLLAPEQITKQRVNGAIDFWSLGASLGDLFVSDFTVKKKTVTNPHYLSVVRVERHVEASRYSGDESASLGGTLRYDFRVDRDATREKQAMFNDFRNMMFRQDDADRFNLAWIDKGKPRADGHPTLNHMMLYYQKFWRKAPAIAKFCLEHLLEPNPGLRSLDRAQDMLELAKFMRDAVNDVDPTNIGKPNTRPALCFPPDPDIALHINTLRKVRDQEAVRAAA